MDENTNCWEILRKFSKIVKEFLKKIAQFLAYFSKNLTNHALIFCAFGRKTHMLGNSEKILKVFDETSIEKLNIYFICICSLENLLLKIEPSEITPFFCNNFFGFGGGRIFPLPPATPLTSWQILKFWHFLELVPAWRAIYHQFWNGFSGKNR